MASSTNSSSNRSLWIMFILVLIAAIAVGIFFFMEKETVTPAEVINFGQEVIAPPAREAVAPTPIETTSAPVYQPPVAETTPVEPLPRLDESDAGLLAYLKEISSQGVMLVVPNEVVRKFVRAVNAVHDGKVVHEYRPIVSPQGHFLVKQMTPAGADIAKFQLLADNYHRYDNFVALLGMIEPERVAALYQRFYPLLEEAYAEMGLKKGNFHTVMIGAIDHLLAAPIESSDLTLVQPKVFYQFADKELEALPQTYKLLLRMGPDNARSLQMSLAEIRDKITQ